MEKTIAVIDATSQIGREIIKVLAERQFPINKLHALVRQEKAGKSISFGDKEIIDTKALSDFDFTDTDLVFSCSGTNLPNDILHKIQVANCILIDSSPLTRDNKDIKMIVPEVNGDTIDNNRIIANPCPSSILIATALKPIFDLSGVTKMTVTTLNPASESGKEGMDELFDQTKGIYSNQTVHPQAFSRRIAFNVIPQMEDFCANGNTDYEESLISEIPRLFDNAIEVTATAIAVPVFIGTTIMVSFECEFDLDVEEAIEIFSDADHIAITSERSSNGFFTPIDTAQQDMIFISRFRKDKFNPKKFNMVICGDNIRKGAALNAVQIAELIGGIKGRHNNRHHEEQ